MSTRIVDLPTFSGPGYTYAYTKSGQAITETRDTIDVRIVAPAIPGDYPVVYWSHGHFSQPYGAGISDPQALADRGFIVIMPVHLDSLDHPDQGSLLNDRFPVGDPASTLYRIADINHLYSQRDALIAGLNTATGGGYTGDFSNTAIAGHSHGAFVAQLLTGVQSSTPEFANLANPAFELAILVSPQGNQSQSVYGLYDNGPGNNSWQNVTAPTLFLVGTEDTYPDSPDISPRDRLDGLERGAPVDRYGFLITGADHEEMANGSVPAVTAAVADAAAAFLDAYANGSAAALQSLLNPAAYVSTHAGVGEAYERAGSGRGGASGGSGAVYGTAAADTLLGLGTSDQILGREGADTIDGAGGNDAIQGGAGRDIMTGGAGNDTFVFSAISDSGTSSSTRDQIRDFDDSGDDFLNFRSIDANVNVAGVQAFTYIGTARFSAPGQVRIVSSGASVLVQVNNDADSFPEMVVELLNTTVSQVTASDFIFV